MTFKHLATGGMAETDANLASGNKNSTPQKITRDQKNQKRQKRMKHPNTTGPDGLVEPRQQNQLVSLPGGITQETSNAPQILKSKIDTTSDNFVQRQIIQKMLLDQWIGDNYELQKAAKMHSHYQRQLQEQFSLPTPEIDRARYQQQRKQLIQNASLQNSSVQASDDVRRCYQRVNQYIRHLRNRPKNNSIEFWRKFVSEFYASCANESWCLSSYENIEQPGLGSFSFPAIEAWCCNICGVKSGKGFEASFEILPRLLQMRFESGELEEIMHLEFPQAYKPVSGIIMLEYGKTFLQTSYEQFRVAREGKLRVFFRNDLKHEEFLPRRLVAPQVNQLIDAANQYQNSIYDCALGKVSAQHLQANGNLFVKSGHQLTRFVELSMINDLGLSAKHGRCLEVAKVVNIMKDLMDFSFERKIGPIESLQTYPCVGNKRSIWDTMQTNEQETAEQLSIRSMALHLGSDSHYSGTFMNSDKVSTISGDDRSVLPNYYQKLQMQNMLNTMASTTRPEQSFLMNQFDQRGTPYMVQSKNPALLNNPTLISLSSLQSSEVNNIVQRHNMDNSFEAMVAEGTVKGVHNALKEQDQCLQQWDSNTSESQPTEARRKASQ